MEVKVGILIGTILIIIAVVGLYYFYKLKEFQKTKNSITQFAHNLKPGDYVMLSGGIYGKIVKLEDEVAIVQVADKVEIRVNHYFIEAKTQIPMFDENAKLG